MDGIAMILISIATGMAATGDLYNSTALALISGLLVLWRKHRNSWYYKQFVKKVHLK